jgi:hypothetical protein
LFENRKMLGDGGLRDPGSRCQRRDRLLSFAAEPLEERPSGGIGEAFEQRVGDD